MQTRRSAPNNNNLGSIMLRVLRRLCSEGHLAFAEALAVCLQVEVEVVKEVPGWKQATTHEELEPIYE